MATINIPETDSALYKSFISGERVRLEAVSLNNEEDFNEGQEITISHLNMEGSAKIVSTPSLKNHNGEKKVLTVTVQKV